MALCVLSQAAAAARERRAEAEARAAAEDAERARAEESALTDEQRQARARVCARWIRGRACLLTCVFVCLCVFVCACFAGAAARRSRPAAGAEARRVSGEADRTARGARALYRRSSLFSSSRVDSRVYVCESVYVCLCLCTCTCGSVCVRACVRVGVFVCVRACVRACVHARVHAWCLCVWECACACVLERVRVRVCACVCKLAPILHLLPTRSRFDPSVLVSYSRRSCAPVSSPVAAGLKPSSAAVVSLLFCALDVPL